MNVLVRVFGVPALGAAFGAATSVSNAWSHKVGLVDGVRVEAGWAWPARMVSQTLDSGWAWAALAVVAGWLAGTRVRGAVAGVLALLAATTAYYTLDPLLRGEPFAMHSAGLRYWLVGSVVCGPALGVVGAYVNHPGVVGLLARLTIPVGATVQMILMPPGSGPTGPTSADTWARLIVWMAAAVGVAVVVARFRAGVRSTQNEAATG